MKCRVNPRYVQLESSLGLEWDEPDERNLALGMVWDVGRVKLKFNSNLKPMTIR